MNPSAPDSEAGSLVVIGLDPAWGERQPDGIAAIGFPSGPKAPSASVETGLVRGDGELLPWIASRTGPDRCLLASDAPTIAPNETGSRPVDRECSRIFRREEAAATRSTADSVAAPSDSPRSSRRRAGSAAPTRPAGRAFSSRYTLIRRWSGSSDWSAP